MKIIGVLVVLLYGLSSFAQGGLYRETPPGVLFVLDTSGSMHGYRLNKVKKVIKKTASQLAHNAAAGLISFSGCGPSYVHLEVPLREGAKNEVIAAAQALQADGSTDIVLALEYALAEAKKMKDDACVNVIFLSDGGDSCNDPSQVTRLLNAIVNLNACNQVNAITLGIDSEWEQAIDDATTNSRVNHRRNVNATKIEQEIQAILEAQGGMSDTNLPDVGWEGDYSGKPTENNNDRRNNNDKPGSGSGQATKPATQQAGSENENEQNN